MAGQPKKRAMVTELARRAALLDEGATVLDYAEQWVASGKTILALSQELTRAVGVEIMRERLSAYLNGLEDGDGERRLARARARASDALADQTLDIAGQAFETREEIAAAKLQIDARQWLAKAWGRETYGDRGNNVTVNIAAGAAHLDALRVRVVEGETELPFEVIGHSEGTQAQVQLQAGQALSTDEEHAH